jgi:ribosomal protein S17E
MITGFAIILDDEVLYVSNENKYPSFEIVLFVEMLSSSINPKNFWRLTNIYFEGDTGKERMIIKHIVTESDQNLFFCITGDFLSNSEEVSKLMGEYFEKVSANYETPEKIKEASTKSEFRKVIKLITGYLWDKYRDPLEDEDIELKSVDTENKIIYCGISTQGLPIISQLYDQTLLINFHREITPENLDLFSSNLSAKLATIAMNTQIRAKTNIKEIHFNDLEDNGCKKLILYSDINDYSLDFIASGDFVKIKEIFKQLEEKVSQEQVLEKEFMGDLKPYRSLKTHLDDVIQKFDQ